MLLRFGIRRITGDYQGETFCHSLISLVSFVLGVIASFLCYLLPFPFFSLQTLLEVCIATSCFYVFLTRVFSPFLINYAHPSVSNDRSQRTHIPALYLENLNCAYGLGIVFGLGVAVFLQSSTQPVPKATWPFGLYLCFLTFFHWSEFFVVTLTKPEAISVDLYMLNHSPEYLTAAAASFIEYALEIWLWPAKSTSFAFVNLLGLSLCIFGEVLRKVAMFTAARNFSHVVQHVRDTEHQLVRHGVYGWFRHPAYVGWFYWSLGTQLLLLNPICSIFYPLAAYTFFKGRIDSEEASLIRFFGDAYRRYQREVGTGLPFIRGHLSDGYMP
ncbi:hypothetical protein AAHC03_0844 [Spirometra sp. Aus1]